MASFGEEQGGYQKRSGGQLTNSLRQLMLTSRKLRSTEHDVGPCRLLRRRNTHDPHSWPQYRSQDGPHIALPRLARFTLRTHQHRPHQPRGASLGSGGDGVDEGPAMSAAIHGMATRPTLCVITPCYNEEQGLEEFYLHLKSELDALTAVEYRIVFVDDGSVDGTAAVLKAIAHRDPSCKVYSLSRNFGHQAAITCGLDAAHEADAVVVMDSDLQHPPTLIPHMVEQWRAGYDVVQAIRGQTAGASPVKRLTSAAFYWIFNRLSDVAIPKGAADFYLLSRRAHEALMTMPERSRFLRGMVAWIGFQRTTINYDAPPRAAGVSKYTRSRMTRLAMDGLVSFSARPIRLATRAGLLLVLVGAAYLSYIIGRWALLGDLVQGWPSLISIVLILGGAQILFIGLLGEYLARVFDESKRRPLYVVKEAPPDHAPPERQDPAHE